MTGCSKGISSYKLAQYLGVTKKTAWLLMHKIRESLVDSNNANLSGVIEVDETWVGGLRKNKHARQRLELRGALADKMPVA